MEKKNLFSKTWERCKSIGKSGDKSPKYPSNMKSRPWNWAKSPSPEGNRVAPNGCFTVYVGPQKQRFVVRTKYANHPLFKVLLEDAEMEYGYNSEGPIVLPCDVGLFYKVLAEMDSKDSRIMPSCGLVYAPCSPFRPSRRLGCSEMGRGHGSYGFLTQSKSLKMNHF